MENAQRTFEKKTLSSSRIMSFPTHFRCCMIPREIPVILLSCKMLIPRFFICQTICLCFLPEHWDPFAGPFGKLGEAAGKMKGFLHFFDGIRGGYRFQAGIHPAAAPIICIDIIYDTVAKRDLVYLFNT